MISSHRHTWLTSILFVFGMLVGQAALAAPTSVRLLPDMECGEGKGDEVRVCGSRIEREDVRRLHELAACLIKNHALSSTAAVTAYIQTGDTARFHSVFASDRVCSAARGLRVTAALLAGAFAEALLDRSMLSRVARGQGGDAPRSSVLSPADTLLHCVMRTGRSEAATFIQSQPYSRQEQSAATALIQKLQRCTTTGDTIRTSLLLLRSMTALTFFAENIPPVGRPAQVIERTATEDMRVMNAPLP